MLAFSSVKGLARHIEGSSRAGGVGALMRDNKISRSEYEGDFEWPVINWGENTYGTAADIETFSYCCMMLCTCSTCDSSWVFH